MIPVPQTTRRVIPVPGIEMLNEYSSHVYRAPIDLKLDANEGPIDSGIPSTFGEAGKIREYPSRLQLEKKLADKFNVEPAQVVVTAGGDDAIDRVCRTFLQSGRNIVLPEPSFVMIRKYATMVGAEVRSICWLDGSFPVQNVIQAADENTAIVAIVSPNNPTGAVVSPEQIRQVATALPNCILLIDQAYAEFEDNVSNQGESLSDVALGQLPNAVVIRTFSKAWGMAGLRVGYALGERSVINWLRRVGSPFPVSGPSLTMATNALSQRPEGHRRYIERITGERLELQRLLTELNIDALPSQANFVYARFATSNLSATFVWTALAALGISVRLFDGEANALRITCPGNKDSFVRLVRTLRTILKPQAVLFDMDGVLVDEAPSYREAIRLTCKSFGESFTSQEIAEKKLEGDANNDWEFTKRILQDRGCRCEYADVKNRFEQFYQGTKDSPGLWQQERRLVDPDWLRTLASRYPLAIVTGRPRHDALRFLESEQILELFSAVVCLEDGPAKPDPANVKTALRELGVQSAWMIGDTPDDINAAKSAGLVALGIVAPQDDVEYATHKLEAACVTTILDDLKTLDGLLP